MAIFDFLSLSKKISDLGAEIRGRRSDLEKLRRERDLIAAAPLSRADAVKAMHRRIDTEGDRYMKTFSASLRAMALGGNPDRGVVILTATPPNTMPTPLSMEAGICLAFADLLKISVSRAVEATPWPEGALDHHTKTERMAKLDSQIGSIENELAALVRSAREAGVSV
jgi:hypothetical protein